MSHGIRRSSIVLVTLAAFAVLACGGGGPTDPAGSNNNGGNGSNNNGGGSSRVLSASVNGAAFTGVTVSGTYLNGNLTVAGSNGGRTLHIAAVNVAGPGTITFGIGNQWNALGQIIDNTAGQFSTGYGGVGTLTLTTATLFRIKGTFSFTAYTAAGTGQGNPVMTVQNGSFDISVP